jgi:ABC-type multidrug transport system permease subunit
MNVYILIFVPCITNWSVVFIIVLVQTAGVFFQAQGFSNEQNGGKVSVTK